MDRYGGRFPPPGADCKKKRTPPPPQRACATPPRRRRGREATTPPPRRPRGVRRAPAARQIIEAPRAELRYLPPYSPDFNPIEQAFSKLKAHLRKAQERSIDTLWPRIGKLLDLFQPTECANFFVNAGYART